MFHHWEFVQDPPPSAFTLRRAEIPAHGDSAHLKNVNVVVVDSLGNIARSQLNVQDFIDVEVIDDYVSTMHSDRAGRNDELVKKSVAALSSAVVAV